MEARSTSVLHTVDGKLQKQEIFLFEYSLLPQRMLQKAALLAASTCGQATNMIRSNNLESCCLYQFL